MDKEILTIEDLCNLLSVSRRTVYNLLKDGKIPGIKIGGQWRFSKKIIESLFLGQQKNENGNNELIQV